MLDDSPGDLCHTGNGDGKHGLRPPQALCCGVSKNPPKEYFLSETFGLLDDKNTNFRGVC